MNLNQLVRRAVQVNGNSLASIDGERQQSWNTLAGNVTRIANNLARLGIKPDDRVAILSNNKDRYIEAFFAITAAGAIAVPLNTRLSPAELSFQLEDSDAKAIFVETPYHDLAVQLRPEAPSVHDWINLSDGTPPDGLQPFDQFISSVDGTLPPERSGSDAAAIMYTGGTTGRPKGVVQSHGALIMNAHQSANILGPTANMAYAHVAPMFHIGDCAYLVAVTLHAGCHIVVPQFEPLALLDILSRDKATHVALVPTMINRLLQEPQLSEFDLTHLRRIIYGASPIPESLLVQAIETLPHVTFAQSYGQTETVTITVLPPERHVVSGPLAGKLRSAGQAATGTDVEIRDGDGARVDAGNLGEICVRSDSLMNGYWNLPDVTAETLCEGWVRTGDIGYMDEDGFVFVVDRLKDMIVTGGENVYSAEVENALHKHPDVVECAVIGIPHDDWGEQVHAIVRLKPGADVKGDAIVEHCRSLIAGYKCPRSVELRTAPLPVSGAGKILKKDLRAAYWDRD